MSAAAATLIFCAPGYPGGSGDAKPFLDQFAKDAAASAGWQPGSLAADYDPTEQGGLAKLADKESVLAFIPYAFYVQHAATLHLTPLVQADVANVGIQERWTLVGEDRWNGHQRGDAHGLHDFEHRGLRPGFCEAFGPRDLDAAGGR